MSDPAIAEPKSDPSPSLWELVLAFNQIALASFGGGLSAWSREIVVVEKKWMDEEEFLSAATMCRILPGANQVNMAVFIGTKFHGIPGHCRRVRSVRYSGNFGTRVGCRLFSVSSCSFVPENFETENRRQPTQIGRAHV